MRSKALLYGFLLSLSLPTASWSAGCSIDIPVVTASHVAVADYPYWSGILSVNVTCPAGQAWTLTSTGMTAANPERFNVSNGVASGLVNLCKPGTAAPTTYTFCQGSTTKLTNLLTLATGTGTGASQLAASMYVSGWGSCAIRNTIYQYSCSTGTYTGVTGNFFQVSSGGIDTVAAASFAGTIPQSCAVTAASPSAIAFTGTADRTANFQIKSQCGYNSAAPVVTTIGPGNNALGETRRASKAGGYIAYHLYWDSAYTNEIGALSNNSVTRNASLYTDSSYSPYVYLKVLRDDPAHSTGGNGTYTDIVTVQVDY